MSDAQVRRRPQQERSKSRVETILDVALEMIIEAGSEDLAMREVARRAEVPISSVYQYFPSKTAIIRELAKRNLERVSLMLQDELALLLAETGGRPTPAQSVERLIGAYYSYYRDHPAATAVWAGAQSDPALRELDFADTRRTAEFLTPTLMMTLPMPDASEAFTLALLFAEVAGSAARLALAVAPPLRDQIIAKLKLMLTATMEAHRPTGAAS